MVRGKTSRWRAARALAFATTAVGIGVLGHAVAASSAPRWDVFLLGVPVVAACAWPLTAVRLRAWVLLAATGLLQYVAHNACALGGGQAAMAGHEHMSAAQHAAHMQHMQHAAEAHAGSTPLMLLVHVLATLAGVAVLLELERFLWRAATTVGRAIARAVTPVRALRPARSLAVATTVSSAPSAPAMHRWRSRAIGRRGPPAFSCA